MSLLFGFAINDADRLRCALAPFRGALRVPAERTRDGWGLGFYQGDEVLLRKRPLAAEGELDFFELAQGVRSDVIVGHVREATVGGRTTENTHPFRFRRWMGACSGTLEQFEPVRAELLAAVPQFLRNNLRGQTDSEHLFHLFLAFLHDAGKLDDPHIRVETAGEALRSTLALADHAVGARGAGVSPLNLLVSNGRVLVATRRGQALHVLRRNGIPDCPICREDNAARGRGTRPVAHEHLRSVLLLSDARPAAAEAGWEQVPDGSIVLVDGALNVRVAPLRTDPPAQA